MASGDKFCYCCRRPLNIDKAGFLPICNECWEKLTPAERAARVEAYEARRQLLAIYLATQNNADLARQMGRLAKVIEAFLREIKQPFSNFQELFDRLNRAINETDNDNDDDEPWRESLKDDG